MGNADLPIPRERFVLEFGERRDELDVPTTVRMLKVVPAVDEVWVIVSHICFLFCSYRLIQISSSTLGSFAPFAFMSEPTSNTASISELKRSNRGGAECRRGPLDAFV